MTERDRGDDIAGRVKTALDRSLDDLPIRDREALRRTRARAVAVAAERGRTGFPWRPTAGIALAASVALAAVLVWQSAPQAPAPVDSAADFEMLVGGDELPLLEDLDFYLWLDALDEAA